MKTKRRFGKVKDYLKESRVTKRAVQKYLARRTQKAEEKKRALVQQYGLKYLSEITTGLQNKDICVFADFGTLLGLVREHSLLKHDLDVDTSVIVQNPEDIATVEKFMEINGYYKQFDYIFEGKIQEQSYVKDELKVDVCYYSIHQEFMSCLLFYWEPGKNYPENQMNVVCKTYTLQKSFTAIDVDGFSIIIPKDPEKLLEEKYGTNWRIPDKGWVYWKGPHTSECNGLGTQIVYGKK